MVLALYLSKNMLPECGKDNEHEKLASLTRTRDTLVKLRTALKSKINNTERARVELGKEALSGKAMRGWRAWGIGRVTGAILLSVIGDVNDLADQRSLANCFGIVPPVSNSNETEHGGRIHNRGTKPGRTALARKFLGIIYRALKNKLVFEDLPKLVLAEAS